MELRIIRQSDLDGDSGTDYAFVSNAQTRRRLIVIDHKNEQLQWSIPARVWSTTHRGGDDADGQVFEEINRYISILPSQSQDAMFETYRAINDILKGTELIGPDSIEQLIIQITPLATKLFSYINQNHFSEWVWRTLRPSIPSDIKDKFDSSMPGTPERTYLSGDIYELIPLILIVRLASPIWLDFTDVLKEEMQSDKKEEYAYSLIDGSWVASCNAMKRLSVFIDHTLGNEKFSDAAVIRGLGSAGYVPWVLSGMVVKKLPIIDVMNKTAETPVVSALFNYVRYCIQSVNTSGPRVNAKFVDTGGDGESNLSYLEGFRNPLQLSEGDKQCNDYYMETQFEEAMKGIIKPMSMLGRIAPDIDPALIADAYRSAKRLENQAITEEQEALAAWLFHPYNQVRATGNFHKERIIQMLAMAQAVFLHQGKVDFAKLVTARYTQTAASEGAHVIGSSVDTPKAAERDAFREFFPLEKTFSGNKKPRNDAYDDIERLVRNLQTYDIFFTFSEETMKRIQGSNTNRRYYLKKNMMSMVMDYAKELAVRPIVRIDPMMVLASIKNGTI